MTRRLVAAIAAVSTLWVGPASAVGTGCVLKPLAQLSVTVLGRQPRLSATLNGASVDFIVDSGAFFSSLTASETAMLKLRQIPVGEGNYVVGVGGVADLGEVRVTDFGFGGTTLHNVVFAVIHTDAGNLIGQNVLGLADTEYDLSAGLVRLMRPYGCGDRALSYWAPGIRPSSAPLISLDDGQYPRGGIAVTVNGSSVRALLDTGAATSLITARAASRLGLTSDNSTASAASGIGRRAVSATVARIDDLKIGDEEVKNTRLIVLDDPLALTGVDVILGADFFLSHHIYVAKSQGKVYFTYNGGPVFAPSQAGAGAPASEAALSDGPAYARRGAAHASRGEGRQAIDDYDRAVALTPNDADIVGQRGQVNAAVGRTHEAIVDLDKSLALRPDQPNLRIERDALLIRDHQPDRAIADLEDLDAKLDKDSDLRLSLGQALSGANRRDEAIGQYDRWIATHPTNPRLAEALNSRCFDHALVGTELPKALNDCNAALRLRPNAAGFLDSRGLVHLRMGELGKAIADYDAALAINPKIAWSLYGRGLAKLKSADTPGGKADLAAATALNPKIATEAAKYGLTPPPSS